MKTLIKNGRVVTAVDDYNADILIEGGKDFGLRLDLAIIAKSELKNYENN